MNTARLAELIKEIRITMLTTIEPDGHVRSRPMATVLRDGFDGTLWFFTSQSSQKIVEVQEDPRVNLSYCEPLKNHYVSISGSCELVRDQECVKQYWDPFFSGLFPAGLDDPDLALLKVTIEAAEYWDAPSGTMMAVAGFTGHEKMKMEAA